jgi:hypothetical protein
MLSRSQGHSAAGRIRSIENSNDFIGNWTGDIPACNIVPQPSTLPHALNFSYSVLLIFVFLLLELRLHVNIRKISLHNFNLISVFTCFNLLIEWIQIFDCPFNVSRSAAALCPTQIALRARCGLSESDDSMNGGPLEHGHRNPAPFVCVYELNAAEFLPRRSVFNSDPRLVVLLVEHVTLGLVFSE